GDNGFGASLVFVLPRLLTALLCSSKEIGADSSLPSEGERERVGDTSERRSSSFTKRVSCLAISTIERGSGEGERNKDGLKIRLKLSVPIFVFSTILGSVRA